MNATALASNVNTLIDDFGNSVVYHPAKAATTYNDEGDWTPTYQTTTVGTNWIESAQAQNLGYTEFGRFGLKDDEVVMKGSVSLVQRGKCVANSINWEIDEIRPIRIKNTTVAQIVTVKQILP